MLFITYSSEQSPSWEANRFSANQEIPRTLWNPKVHHRTHKCRHLSLSRASSIPSILPHPTSWWSILISSSYLRLGLPSCLFSSPLHHLCYKTRSSHSSRFYHPNNTRWGVQMLTTPRRKNWPCYKTDTCASDLAWLIYFLRQYYA